MGHLGGLENKVEYLKKNNRKVCVCVGGEQFLNKSPMRDGPANNPAGFSSQFIQMRQ